MVKAPTRMMTTSDITLSSFCCSLYRLPSLFSVYNQNHFGPSCQRRPGRNTGLWFWCCALLSLSSYAGGRIISSWCWCPSMTLIPANIISCMLRYRLQDTGVFSLLHKPGAVYCQREVQKSLVKLIGSARLNSGSRGSTEDQRIPATPGFIRTPMKVLEKIVTCNNKRHRAEHTENTVKMETVNMMNLFIPRKTF